MYFYLNSSKNPVKKSKKEPFKTEVSYFKEKMEILYKKVLDDLLIIKDKLPKTEWLKVFVTLSNFILPEIKSLRDKLTFEKLKEKRRSL